MRHLLLLCALLIPTLLAGEQTSLRLLFVGDSITDGGWGRSAGMMLPAEERNLKDQNHLYGHSYMFIAAATLEAENPTRGFCCFNRGISGYTLADLHARWEADIEALAPDLLTILIGINDVLKHYDKHHTPFDTAAWEASYRAYIERTREHFPHTHLILCTPFLARAGRTGDRADFEQVATSVKASAEVVRRLAAEYGATLVDFADRFDRLTEQYPTTTASHWIWDGIHPTPAGHHQMARCWLERIGTF